MKNEIIFSNLSNISARIVPADLNTPKKAGVICQQHYHDEVEFLYIHSGEFVCIVNDKEYVCKPGEIVFINSRIPHYTRSNTDNTYTSMLQYSPSDIGANAEETGRYLSRFINISKKQIVCFKKGDEKTEELKGYLETVFREYSTKSPAYEHYIKAGIFAITAFLFRHEFLVDTSALFSAKNITKLLPTLEYIDKNHQKHITLEEISSFFKSRPVLFLQVVQESNKFNFY